MEEVLQLYTSVNNPRYPLVCFDEASKQLVKETRTPVSAQPGAPECYDSECERKSTANLFVFIYS